MMGNPLGVGDRVRHKTEPKAMGKVLNVQPPGELGVIATVFWDLEWHDRVSAKILVTNLERVD
jgi:hypothetical protein